MAQTFWVSDMPYKNFTPTQLTASEVNTYLMKQSVMVFANSAARSSSLTAPTEGMVTYLQDTDELEIYNGSTWLRAVVTSDDESISTSGDITSSSGNISATTGAISSGGSATIGGSLTVDTSSLKVDATNDVVGIMTSTPATGQYNDLSVDISSGRVRIGGNRNGGTAGISSGTGTPTASWYSNTAFIGLDGSANSSNVGLWHTGNWRLLIDTTGRVTTPYQPVVQYWGSPYSTAYPAGSAQVLKFPNQTYSVSQGSYGYNTSTGRYYAPISGYYQCTVNLGTYSSGSNYSYWRVFLRNSSGGEIASNLSNISYIATGTHDFLTLSVIRYLTVGDYVYWEGDTGVSNLQYYGTQFTDIRLLG